MRSLGGKKMLLAVLALSGIVHLVNVTGFPDIFYDEGIYMRRAMYLLDTGSPQDSGTFYDHPYFGQIFLGAVLGSIGYPSSLNPTADPQSMEALYSVPRVLMGLLAIADTFLIYKIADVRYGRKVAIIASILFAVMPAMWLTRRILLDNILLPFLLSSILLALYSRNAEEKSSKRTALVLLSGAALGIAIFTKVPVFVFMPLVASLVYTPKSKRLLALWLAPVVLIPMIWPAYSMSLGQFDYWQEGVLWQAQRESNGLLYITEILFSTDPVLLVLGAAGAVLAAVLRDRFVLLWIVPFVLFLAVIGYMQYFYWIPILPALCVAAGILFAKVLSSRPKILAAAVAVVAAFGLASTLALVTTNVTSAQYSAMAFLATKIDDDTTFVANPVYAWVLKSAFGNKNGFSDYRDLIYSPVRTDHTVVVAEGHFMSAIDDYDKLRNAYEKSGTIATFENDPGKPQTYPYTPLNYNWEGRTIDIRASSN
ncbi:ArnT family glycosyltransferase [Nitrososphaera viennensis]|uniref:ArnT family glycosyltransferase n=1 Tax=Nitrososphaera viennensis TaxID=1034015 RepID=UPI0021B06F0E|nr:phospholipid carrier-dependent glycosyltransferase [Nitrososphaera viennensis]